MKNLHLSSKMSVHPIGNIRNKIIPVGFLDRLWLVIYGRDSCHFPRCGVHGKQQCLCSTPGQVGEAAPGRGEAAVRTPLNVMGTPRISFMTHGFRNHAGWIHTFKFIWYNFLNGSNSKKWRMLQPNLLSLFIFAFNLSNVQGHRPVLHTQSRVWMPRMHNDWNSFLFPSSIISLRKKNFKTPFIRLTSVGLTFA